MKLASLRKWQAASPQVVRDWISESTSINTDIQEQGRALRARARDLEQNSDYVAKFLQLIEVNVIGEHGVRLQAKARTSRGKPDSRTNRIIERAWNDWARPGSCSADGRLSWQDIQRLAARSIARDGEVIIRLVRGNGLKLIVYEADYLDQELNSDRTDSTDQIIQGIEVARTGEPVAYHLLKRHPGDAGIWQDPRREHERVPAADILHIYRSDRPGQIRGASWLAPAMIHLLMLNRYERAEMAAAEISAKKLGFYKTPTGDWLEESDDATEYGLPNDINGLGMTELPAGVDMGLLDPNHPVTAFGDYVRAVLRGIATGLGVSYHALSGDLTAVSFSSIRSGTLEERDRWRSIQQWIIQHLHQRVFDAWITESVGNLGVSAAELNRVNLAAWQPRGWQWVDPQKDINAALTAHEAGLISLSDIAAAQGRDLESVYEQIQKDAELAKQYGLVTEAVDATD
jgi:lambda family phage portal protein